MRRTPAHQEGCSQLPHRDLGFTRFVEGLSRVLAQGAYHGDTQGAMDAVPPSAYNSFRQAPW